MFAKRTVSVLLIVSICVLIFAGCGNATSVVYTYKSDAKIETLSSQVLAENDRLKLSWDNTFKGITLEDKENGKIWSNLAQNADGTWKNTSTLDITVQDMQIFQSEFISGLDAQNNNKLSSKKIKNGIELTYYFDKVEVSVPVRYELRKDSLKVSIDSKKITESGKKYRLLYAIPSPMLMAVEKTLPDSYLFIPDGMGAIVYNNECADGEKRIDGDNTNIAALSTTSETNKTESSGIRVFGVKANEAAMLGIPEDTSGAVGVYLTAGDVKSDYSKVYPKYFFVDTDYTKGKASNAGDVRLLSDRAQLTVSVGYYPLSGENANYNGMAKRYRKYLQDSGYISNTKKDFSSPYAVTAMGGVKSLSSIVGVPVQTLKSMTTFNEAKELVENIVKETDTKPVVRLQGYGESGLNIGKIAGGYKFASLFGSNKDRLNLQKYCQDEKMQIFIEFDMINYSKSGNGFSYANDAAKTATLHTAENYAVNIPLREFNKKTAYRLLGRGKLGKAVDKLIKMAQKKDISGVSLASLGQYSYSDYTDGDKYAVTGLMAEDTKDYINKIKDNKIAVSGSASTYFAAGLLDVVFDAPLDPLGKYQFDREIPFYQMVFAGVTPLYSASVNTASDPNKKIMLAASTGTGLGFNMAKNFSKDYMETNVEKLYACSYDNTSELIKSSLKSYAKIYDKIKGQKIDRYDLVDDNVTKTTFENGVTVYANHASFAVDSPVGKLKAYGFKMERD